MIGRLLDTALLTPPIFFLSLLQARSNPSSCRTDTKLNKCSLHSDTSTCTHTCSVFQQHTWEYNSEGGCRQANCRYLHAYKKPETCRRYNGEQGCRYGRYCIYNHSKAQTQPGAKNGEPKTIRSETPAKNDQCAQLEKLMESVANLTRLMTANVQAQQQNGNISRQQENYTHQYQQPQQTNLQTAQPQIHTYPYNATSMSQPIPPVTYYTQTN